MRDRVACHGLFGTCSWGIAAVAATGAGVSAIFKKGGYQGLAFAGAYVALVLVVQLFRFVSRKSDHDAGIEDSPG